MTREDENRVIAEWLYPWLEPCKFSGCDHSECTESLDFRTSEEGCALLRRELPNRTGFSMTVQIDPGGSTAVDGLGIPAVYASDEKDAIVEAALKLIAAGEKP